MKAKFTPAPWCQMDNLVCALEESGYKNGIMRYSNRFSAAIQSDGSKIPREELKANALLIKAAPDLYEALKGICDIELPKIK